MNRWQAMFCDVSYSLIKFHPCAPIELTNSEFTFTPWSTKRPHRKRKLMGARDSTLTADAESRAAPAHADLIALVSSRVWIETPKAALEPRGRQAFLQQAGGSNSQDVM